MWFKVTCLVIAIMFLGFFAWCLNDARANSTKVLEHTRVIAETGVEVSKDVKALRVVLGIGGGKDNFLQYVAHLLIEITQAGDNAQIGIGEDMKDAKPAAEWANSARAEALALAFKEDSEEKILDRLCKTFPLRKPFFIQIGSQPAQELKAWLIARARKK